MTPRYTLVVTVPTMEVFNAYWFGYGTIANVDEVTRPGSIMVTVDYGTDHFHAETQGQRFASGLYWSNLLVS